MENPLELIERHLERVTQAELAAHIGVSAAYLSMVRRGNKPVGPKILEFLGIEKAVTYRKRNGNGAAKRGRANGR